LWAKLLSFFGVKTAWGLLAKALAFVGISVAVDESIDWITGDENAEAIVQEKVNNYLKKLATKIENQRDGY
jgi:hypothetical protein